MELKDKLISQLDNQYFPPKGSALIVAVSGGVDSMVLLNALVLLSAQWDWQLIVAHFNHNLRKSAGQDVRFVKAATKMLGLEFIDGKENIVKLAKAKKLTIEEAGRMARYAWLQKAAQRYRASTIALGHTADDQAETVTMNWLRGGLVRALAGMRIKEDNLWRPLLNITKVELYQFAKKYHIKFREDPSNQNPKYVRNLIRHQILPMLQKVNPGIPAVLVRNADSWAELEVWLNESVIGAYKRVALSGRTDEVNFSEKKFSQLANFLQNELLLLAIEKLKGDRQDIKKVHLDEMRKVLATHQKTAWKQLPGKLFLFRGCGKISVSRHQPKLTDR